MSRWWACAVAGLVAMAAPSLARAQTFQLFGPDRSRNRHESAQNFLIELRGGPWYPDVDAEFNGRATPFADMFGTADRVLVGAEFDWQFLRVNPLGSIGLGVGAGYTSASAVAPLTQIPMPAAASWQRPTDGQETSLHVIPGYAVAVVRLDVLARRTVIPLVPYVKYGVGYAYWWITNGDTLARRSLSLSPGARGTDADLGQAATGGTLGTHFAAGLMLRLDVFEPMVQRAWDLQMGVNHSYLFAEYVRSDLSGLGARPQLRLGTETWNVGLAMEF
jgi:hypothetical protein